MAAPNQDAPMQRLNNAFQQLPPLFLDVIRGTLRDEVDRVARRSFMYQCELHHALEHNTIVMRFSQRDPALRFIVLPLENGGGLPDNIVFPETMRDLLLCGDGRMRRLLQAYGLDGQGPIVDVRLQFLDYIMNGP